MQSGPEWWAVLDGAYERPLVRRGEKDFALAQFKEKSEARAVLAGHLDTFYGELLPEEVAPADFAGIPGIHIDHEGVPRIVHLMPAFVTPPPFRTAQEAAYPEAL